MIDDDNESQLIEFDVLWNYLWQNRHWHTCAGLILDTLGRLSVFGDDSDETAATFESLMRVLEDSDGSFLMRWKERFRVNPAGTIDAWRRHIEPFLINSWMKRANGKAVGEF